MILRFSSTLMFLCFSIFSTIQAQNGLALPEASSCDETVQKFLDTWKIPGANIAIAKDGKLFYTRGVGVLDESTKEKVQPFHKFRLGGISKTITAVAILKLVEEGKLSLDDKVIGKDGIIKNGALLEFNITDDRIYDITVGQLLMHSGGWDASQACPPFSDEACDPIFIPLAVKKAFGGENPPNAINTIGFALEQGLQFDPGSDFAYSNVGYLLLEQVIRRVARMRYERFVKTNLLDPLNICDFSIGKTLLEDRHERESFYHTTKQSPSVYDETQTVSAAYGQFNLRPLLASNGIVGTAEEMLRFILAIDGFDTAPDILSAASIDALTTTGKGNPNYAKGIQIDADGNWWHLGSLPGSSSVWGRTADGYSWVALFNQDTLERDEVSASFSNEFNKLILDCISQLPAEFTPQTDLFARPIMASNEIQALVIKENSMVLSWLSGEADGRVLLMKKGSPVDAFPIDGEDYEVGDELGNGNFVVYKGDGAAVNLKELEAYVDYHFRLFDFNELNLGGEDGQNKLQNIYQVGCSAIANFMTLPQSSDCKCLSNRMEDICEDFESFFGTTPIGLQSNCWTTSFGLEGSPLDALVSNTNAFSGSQSLSINGSGQQDVVFALSDRKKGRYEVKWKMLIPAGKTAAFAIQQSQASKENPNISVKLGKDSMDTPLLGDTTRHTTIIPEDEWFTVSQVFDLDNDKLDLMIGDDVVVSDFKYEGDLGGINFFSEDVNSQFFVDDVEVNNLNSPGLDGDLPNLTCSSSGSLSINNNILLIEDLEVKNDGEGIAAGSSIGFFLSDNTSFTTLDTYIGENFINGLDPEESIQITFGADISSLGLTPGEYFVGFIIDYKNVVQELDEEDNNDCFFLTPKVIILPPPIPDLVCSGEGTLSITNDVVNITDLTISNTGNATSTNTTVGFYLTPNDNVTVFDIEIGTTQIGPLAVGESAQINFTKDLTGLNVPDDEYQVGVIVDYTEEQEEESETNNTCLYDSPKITFPLGAVNLTCDSLGSLTINGPVIEFTDVRFTNNGALGAGSHKIGVYLSEDDVITVGDDLIQEIQVDTLPAGGSLLFSGTIDITGLSIPDGTYFVSFFIDKDQEVAEADETDNNNCYFDNPTITLPFIPNLTCDSLGSLVVNQTVIDIQDLKLVNNGFGHAGAHKIGIYLSADTIITDSDTLLSEIEIDTLPAGAVLTLSATIDINGISMPSGSYYVGILVDKDSTVVESDESDNYCHYPGTLVNLPIGDPNLTCAESGTLTITDGVVDIADFKYTNDGPTGAGSHVVGIYLSTNLNFTSFDVLVGEITVDTLGAGDTASLSFTSDLSGLQIADGTYFVGFILDKDQEVDESEEDDNNDCFYNNPTITFPVFGDPNLVCNNSGNLTVNGTKISITDLEILNDGDGPSASSFVGFYISSNTTFTELDPFIGEAQVKALDKDGSDTISFEVDLDTLSLPFGEYYVGYILDYKEEVDELLEIDNANCYFVTPKVTIEAPKPNLICEDLGNLTVTGGTIINVDDFKYKNVGAGAAAGHRVGFYLSADANITTSDEKIGEVFINGTPVNGVVNVDFSVDVTSLQITPGSYFLGYILDNQDDLDESDETDNTCYYTNPKVDIPFNGKPNLVCGDIGTLNIDGNNILSLTDMQVTNNGTGISGASTLAIYLSTNTTITSFDNLILEIPVGGLNPGESQLLSGQVDLKTLNITTGDYYVGLYIDNEKVVDESNESDNNDCFFISPKVSFPLNGEPNLSCKDPGVLDIDGLEITIAQLEYVNSGNEKAGAHKIGFYLSTDGNFTTSDVLIGTLDIGEVAAGETVVRSFQTILDPNNIPDDTYMVGFIIDYLDDVDEQFELDNKCGFKDPVVTLPLPDQPDLTCKENGNITCDDWDIYLENVWLQNIGDGPSGATSLCVYLSPDNDFSDNDNYLVETIDLPALDAGESIGITENIELANFKDIIPHGTYYIALIIDCEDKVAESDEKNNICLYSKTITLENPKKPDLICKYRGDLTIDDWDIYISKLQVKNIGDAKAGATEVCVVLSEDKVFNKNDLIVKKAFLPALEPGQLAQMNINIELMDLNVPYGNYYVGIIIDCDDKVEEYDDVNNNICYWDIILKLDDPKKPDLTCKEMGTIICDEWDIILKDIWIQNIGKGASENAQVCVYLSKDNDFDDDDNILVKTMFLPALVANGTAGLSANIELMDLNIPYGTYYVALVIDCEDEVMESNEKNNICIYNKTLKLEAPKSPDLACKYLGSFKLSSNGVKDNMLLTLEDIIIINNGDAKSDATKVAFYLSENNTITTNDLFLGEVDLNMLDPGEVADLDFQVDLEGLNVPYGDYFIGVIIDYQDTVDESDEANNTCYFNNKLELEEPGEPDLTCMNIGELTIDKDWKLSIKNLKIINNGTAKSGLSRVGIYLSTNKTITTNDIFLGSIVLKMLEPGQTAWLTFDAMLEDMKIPDGVYYVGILIDDEDAVNESDEKNNTCCYDSPRVKIEKKALPDLTCKESGEISCDDWDIYIKNAWIQNIGNAKAEGTTVCVYLSPDNNFDDNDNYLVETIDLGALEPGESAGITENIELANFKDLIPYGTYYIALIIDCENDIMESNESNNICYYSKTITLETPEKPDLTCKESGDISCDDWDIYIKNAWIQNIGDAKSEATKVCVYLSPDNNFNDNDNYLVETIDLGALEPGESAGITENIELANFKDLIPYGTYYIALIIDCENDVDESNEDNNICYYSKTITLETPKKPDLTCKESGEISCDDWDIYIKNAWIQNIGDAKSEATKVCVYLSPDNNFNDNDNYLVETIDLGALEPGESAGITENIELANFKDLIPYGTYYIALIIDCENDVDESNEDNNICYYSKTITLETPKKPDLTCKENGEISCDDWDIFIKNAWIQNIGDARSEATTVCVYLSPDKNFNDNDNYLVETIDLGALDPGETAGITENIELANFKDLIPYGTYYIALIIDCEDNVHESNEDNNICYYNKTITLESPKKPDLTCKENGEISCDDWDIFIKNAWIQNIGDARSEATTVCVYLSPDNNFNDNDNYLVETIDLGALDPGETAGITENIELANFKDLIPYGTYYIALIIDCEDNVHESNEYNNICYYSKTITLKSPKKPDITCKESGNLWYNDWDLTLKDIWVQNMGEAASTKTDVCVYISKDSDFSDNDNILLKTVDLEALNPDQTTGLDITIELMNLGIAIPYGEYYVAVVLDCSDNVKESNEYNNICIYNKKIKLESGDLPDWTCKDVGLVYLDSIEDPKKQGTYLKDQLKLTIEKLKVSNIGQAKSEATKIGVYLSLDEHFGDSDDVYIGRMNLPATDAGGNRTRNASMTIDTKDLPPGGYYIGYFLDYQGKIVESDEDNNQCYALTKLYHLVEPPLECACEEAAEEYFCESFEKYNAGNWVSSESSCWRAYIYYEDQGNKVKSTKVRSGIGVGSSQAIRMDDKGQTMAMMMPIYTWNIYRLTWMMMVPEDSSAYVAALKSETELTYTPPYTKKGLHFSFGASENGKGQIIETSESFDYPVGEWFEVEVILDLTTRGMVPWIKVNGEVVSQNSFYNGDYRLSAMNFEVPDHKTNYVVDNIQLEKLDEVPDSGAQETDNEPEPDNNPGNGGGDPWGSWWNLNSTNDGNPASTAKNGATSLSNPEADRINDNKPAIKQYTIYPNPTDGIFKIGMNLNRTEDVEVFIMNTMGQMVRRLRFDQVNEIKENINLSKEPSGLYLVRIQVGEESYNSRLLLERQ